MVLLVCDKNCKQPIHAYWCDNEGEMAHSSECTRPDKSWEIKSGAKEQSWTRTNHSIGHRKLYIHAANACLLLIKVKMFYLIIMNHEDAGFQIINVKIQA
jgi:hypothetical protein